MLEMIPRFFVFSPFSPAGFYQSLRILFLSLFFVVESSLQSDLP